MNKPLAPDQVHEFRILEQLEDNPNVTQTDLAVKLDVAVGTVNWYVKRLIRKGYVKASRLQRRRMSYLVTPKGIAEKTRLAIEYVQVSMNMYRGVRQSATKLLLQLQGAGYQEVCIEGDGDLADVVRLTCLEHNIGVESISDAQQSLPTFIIEGAQIKLHWNQDRNAGSDSAPGGV